MRRSARYGGGTVSLTGPLRRGCFAGGSVLPVRVRLIDLSASPESPHPASAATSVDGINIDGDPVNLNVLTSQYIKPTVNMTSMFGARFAIR